MFSDMFCMLVCICLWFFYPSGKVYIDSFWMLVCISVWFFPSVIGANCAACSAHPLFSHAVNCVATSPRRLTA